MTVVYKAMKWNLPCEKFKNILICRGVWLIFCLFCRGLCQIWILVTEIRDDSPLKSYDIYDQNISGINLKVTNLANLAKAQKNCGRSWKIVDLTISAKSEKLLCLLASLKIKPIPCFWGVCLFNVENSIFSTIFWC